MDLKKSKCPKCLGKGWYCYDENHGKPCEECCSHDAGWFLLKEYYGESNNSWCCLKGCGFTVKTLNFGRDTLQIWQRCFCKDCHEYFWTVLNDDGILKDICKKCGIKNDIK